jgi:hypothetical protein
MNDQLAWLDRLGSARPFGAAVLTAEILDRAGPAPVPFAADAAGFRTASFLALRVVPLLADDNSRRASLRAAGLRGAGALEHLVRDAEAESCFWLRVRDFACTWSGPKPQDHEWRQCCPSVPSPG